MMQITPIPCLTDNYAYIISDNNSKIVGVVDPSEASPIVSFLNKKKLNSVHFKYNIKPLIIAKIYMIKNGNLLSFYKTLNSFYFESLKNRFPPCFNKYLNN